MDLEDNGKLYGEEDEFFEEEEAEEDIVEGDEGEPDPLSRLYRFHPEAVLDYAEKVATAIPLTSAPPINDEKHTSQPFLTLYEKTKILGFRANQLAQGAPPYVTVPEYVKDVTEIAKMELDARRLPFIVKRPMPDGTFEYWRLSDMMVL